MVKIGGRYLISGTQIGTLMAMSKVAKYHDVDKMLNEIIENNFVGDSRFPLKRDIEKIEKVFFDERNKKTA